MNKTESLFKTKKISPEFVKHLLSMRISKGEILVIDAFLIGEDISNKGLAKALFISDKTIKFHLTSIYKKLDIKDRTGFCKKSKLAFKIQEIMEKEGFKLLY